MRLETSVGAGKDRSIWGSNMELTSHETWKALIPC